MDDNNKKSNDIVQLARLGMLGDSRGVQTYVRRIVRGLRDESGPLADELRSLLASAPSSSAPLRDAGGGFAPVDRDSRLQLLRHESPVIIDHEPILAPEIAAALDLVISERKQLDLLAKNDLAPTSTLLFTGLPGVGKTLSARWLAAQLKLPLLTLDLSTVISSFLGRTGANLRQVLDYAKEFESVLLLDEFDAIAKRRGDDSELGELKRLVTVLLQEIDAWPSNRLLVAATNHGELLDRAVWRRFDLVLEFPLPRQSDLERVIALYFGEQASSLGEWQQPLMELFRDRSFSDIERLVGQIRRRSIVGDIPLEQAILATLSGELNVLSLADRKQLGERLRRLGLSDRKISAALGLARDTLRKMSR